ncbi:unnamed protein product, partial [Oppiella nova]
MGIIVRDHSTNEILLLLKGADAVMTSIVVYSDWLQEQCDTMARDGLRTLVVAKKTLTEHQYLDFESRYNQAKCAMTDRNAKISAVLVHLQKDMELLCLTAHLELNNFSKKDDCPLIIRGEDLELVMKFYSTEFMELAGQCPAVVCCRCSPTQKAEVVKLIQNRTGRRTCAVGDGGNDVSMIQSADVGVGIVGKEGQQASLAADFSILQF